MQELIKKIEQWAIDRELDKKGTVEGQSIKTAEEIAELIKGVSKDDMDLIKDSIGDVFVTFVIGNMLDEKSDIEEIYKEAKRNLEAHWKENKKYGIDYLAQTITDIIRDGYYEDSLFYGLISLLIIVDIYNLDFKNCVEIAYNEIANRKGKMINGTFVKSEDLPMKKLKNNVEFLDSRANSEKQELPYEITDMQGMFAINNTDIPF